MTAITQEKTTPAAPAPEKAATVPVSGLVDLAEGHGFVLTSGYRRGPGDVYISAGQIRQYGLRKGDLIEGAARPDTTQAKGAGRASGCGWKTGTPPRQRGSST